MKTIETWKPCPNQPGYEVSSLGNIRTLERRVKSRFGARTIPPKIRKLGDLRGYKILSTTTRSYRVHRIVAEAFIPNPLGLPVVNHIDGNKGNNEVSNLEWCTHSQNDLHAVDLGLKKPRRRCPVAQARNKLMLTDSKNGMCYRDIAKKYNKPLGSIGGCIIQAKLFGDEK